MTLMRDCEDYLNSRTGKYEWRRVRYIAVADLLIEAGLNNDDLIIDVGAGWTEFDYCLRAEYGWRGRYLPVDGQFDGTDLNLWTPPREASFIVAIELLEHLFNPMRMMLAMRAHASKLIVATTPNPATTDVLGMDPTHVTPLPEKFFKVMGWQTRVESFYGQVDDSILAWRKP